MSDNELDNSAIAGDHCQTCCTSSDSSVGSSSDDDISTQDIYHSKD